MDYGKIIGRSFEIAWRYKSLWVFGMFASGSFNIDFSSHPSMQMQPGDFGMPSFPPELLGMFIIAAIVLGLVFLVAGQISQAAIIDSTNRIVRGGRYRFGDAFSAGIDYFLRFLGLFILFVFAMLVPTIIMVIIIAVFFAIHTALGVLSLLFFIPAMIFVFFLMFSIWVLAQRVVVVRNSSIGDAIEEGWVLVKKNFGKTLVMFLIYIAFTIGFGIAAMILWALFSLPVAGLGLMGGMDPLQAMFTALLWGLPVSLVVGGILGVFFTSFYTLFYFELVEPSATTMQAPPMAPPIG